MASNANGAATTVHSPSDAVFEELCACIDGAGFVPSRAQEPQKKETFWQIGKALDAGCTGDDRHDRSETKRLGARLNSVYKRGFGGNTLTEALRTYRAFPDRTKLEGPLTWKHYVVLSRVKDEALRQTLLNKAVQRGWDTQTLALYAEGDPYSPWRGLYGSYHREGFHDHLVELYAIAYAGSCGVISVERLRDIYLQDVEEPVDSFDFNETIHYLGQQRLRERRLLGLWSQDNKQYVVETTLAEELGERDYWGNRCGREDDFPYARNSFYDEEEPRRQQVRALLEARRRTAAKQDIERLAARNEAHPIRLLPRKAIESAEIPSAEVSILGMPAFQRLTTQLCNPRPSEIDPQTGLCEAGEEMQYGVLRLSRQVMRRGLPSRDDIAADALYLIALSGVLEPSESLVRLVLQTLTDLYRNLPLWTLGGHSQADLERGLTEVRGAKEKPCQPSEPNRPCLEHGKSCTAKPKPGPQA